MIFDITTTDSAYKFILEFFDYSDGMEFIEDYAIECEGNFDKFWHKKLEYITSVDITSVDITDLKFKVLHVTTSCDACLEIKNNGIKNLQKVLSETGSLRAQLLKSGIRFDIENKILIDRDKLINIDYNMLKDKQCVLGQKDRVKNVARKIYYDYQINGFFSNNDVTKYGTEIYRRPEFLRDLIELVPRVKEVEDFWKANARGYIITFLAGLTDFQLCTFDYDEDEYNSDMDELVHLKRWIISRVIDKHNESNDNRIEVYAYLREDKVIDPDSIVSYELIEM